MRLSTAFKEGCGADAHMVAHGPGDVRVIGLVSPGARAVIDRWSWALEVWWRQGPTAIYECERCGEIRLTLGKKAGKKCADRKKCKGTMVALEPPFNTNRPRRRKIEIT